MCVCVCVCVCSKAVEADAGTAGRASVPSWVSLDTIGNWLLGSDSDDGVGQEDGLGKVISRRSKHCAHTRSFEIHSYDLILINTRDLAMLSC